MHERKNLFRILLNEWENCMYNLISVDLTRIKKCFSVSIAYCQLLIEEHLKNYVFIFFHTKWNMITLTISCLFSAKCNSVWLQAKIEILGTVIFHSIQKEMKIYSSERSML